ncbi:MAG TPA: flavin-dependent oxidoreductase [Alphaproteobacteria bacterium]|nr:flavin-dependent oxidoreductase [Alphaproteobacteria bacterium]
MDVLIIGGGIGGLTLGLMLHKRGIPCRIFEAAPEIKPLGVGINILPHASKELCELGLEADLARVAVTTANARYFNRFGQLIYVEPLGRNAGYDWPQFSIHRGDLHEVLLDAFVARAGRDRYLTGWQCTRIDQDGDGATAHFQHPVTREALEPRRGAVAIGCDGIHSAVRKQLYPEEGPPIYSGVNMWRGVIPWQPILDGASMTRVGWLTTGKMVLYPIRNNIDAQGRQLMNWVWEIETTKYKQWDWSRPGRLEDFIDGAKDWHFDWLDVPAFFRTAETILEYPMVDKDPVARWSFGRITLLGDAAHPMYPRGSNGAGQAILDARALADRLAGSPDWPVALADYEALRLPATAKVVHTNRSTPPDAILREVYQRTGDKPFKNIDDVIGREELAGIVDAYKRVAGYTKEGLRAGGR